VTLKTKFLVPAAAALLGLAVVTALWLRHGSEADNPTPQPEPTPPVSAQSKPADAPTDPEVMGQIREAYQKSLAENAPPGMIELMQGPGAAPPGDLPPIPDPFLIPAGHQDTAGPSSGELPPLPSGAGGKPKPLPPIDAAPVPDKKPKEGPSPDLPPLPPVK
jgi:hypothetical protein